MDSGGLRYFTENGINPFPCVRNVTLVIPEKRVIIWDFCLFYSSVDLISQSHKAHPSFARPSLRCEFFALSLSNINFLRSGVSQGEFVFRTFFRRKGAFELHMFKNIFLQEFQATLESVIFSRDCHGARAKSVWNMVWSKFLSCLLFIIVGAPAGIKAFLMA